MSSEAGQMTAGELRQVIQAKGYGWSVDPRLLDGDPIPRYAMGGALPRDGGEAHASDAELDAILQDHPPANPFLRARWIEAGLLPSARESAGAGSPADLASPPSEDVR